MFLWAQVGLSSHQLRLRLRRHGRHVIIKRDPRLASRSDTDVVDKDRSVLQLEPEFGLIPACESGIGGTGKRKETAVVTIA